MLRLLSTLLASLLIAGSASADNWPGWRGATGQGHSPEKDLPLTWGPKENVRWKVKLPDTGNSTPVVWGDRVFVTQASDKVWPPQTGEWRPGDGQGALALCFARADGKLLWQKDVSYEEPESTHPTNPFCSASPATDGERVVVSHGSAGLFCYDFDGKELWNAGTSASSSTSGATPPRRSSTATWSSCGAAPASGSSSSPSTRRPARTVWQHDEPGGASGRDEDKGAWIGSWSTPIIVKIGEARIS